ncbi:MAG: Uncharacterised protein [Formosa sp. Hel3_A1_48]|nr:MAG: Uncharacterised protein [Formosa sp. Hel3_A1_48]
MSFKYYFLWLNAWKLALIVALISGVGVGILVYDQFFVDTDISETFGWLTGLVTLLIVQRRLKKMFGYTTGLDRE